MRFILSAGACAVLALLFVPVHPAHAAGEDFDSPAARLEALSQLKREVLWEGARARAATAGGARTPARATTMVPLSRIASPARMQALSADRIINDNAGDLLLGITNAEVAMGAVGQTVLATWNDGAGNDRQGWGVSFDGGFTWFDGGAVPAIGANWRWRSDPVIAVDHANSRIFFAALAESSTTRNAIVLLSYDAAFLVWNAPQFVRRETSSNLILDKHWIAYDPSFDVVHVAYTVFDIPGGTNAIEHMAGLYGGTNWSLPFMLSNPLDAGRVQGARIVAIGNGDVAATWAALGTPYPDHVRFRRTTAGLWDPEVTTADFYSNIGTGAPGYNRPASVYFPSLAFDQVLGSPNIGRIWVAWPEAYNSEDDILLFPPLAGTPMTFDFEPNDNLGTATNFTPGDALIGFSSSTADADYYACFLNAGEHLILWADTLAANQLYTLEVRGPADLRLALGGDTRPPTTSQTYYTVTAPIPAVYFVRFRPTSAGVAGTYRIRTLLGQAAPGDRGRDRRDVFAAYTDNGVTWSLPAMMSDSPIGYDDWLPEIQIGEDGHAYGAWYDFRDDPYGAESHIRVAAALQPAAGFAGSHVLSSTLSDWTGVNANFVPNQGDYLALTNDPYARFLRAGWADARNATPDVYTNFVHTHFDCVCPPDISAHANSVVSQDVLLRNVHPFYDYEVAWEYHDQAGFIGPVQTTTVLPPGPGQYETISYTVPNLPAGTVLDLQVNAALSHGPLPAFCAWQLTVLASVAVEPGAPLAFGLDAPAPNPAAGTQQIAFTLPAEARARLTVHDLAGARVRVLSDATFPAGGHLARWDGRDETGRLAAPGVYYVRLESREQVATRRIVRVR